MIMIILSTGQRFSDFLIDPLTIVRHTDVNARLVRFAAMLTPAGYPVQDERAWDRRKHRLSMRDNASALAWILIQPRRAKKSTLVMIKDSSGVVKNHS